MVDQIRSRCTVESHEALTPEKGSVVWYNVQFFFEGSRLQLKSIIELLFLYQRRGEGEVPVYIMLLLYHLNHDVVLE